MIFITWEQIQSFNFTSLYLHIKLVHISHGPHDSILLLTILPIYILHSDKICLFLIFLMASFSAWIV